MHTRILYQRFVPCRFRKIYRVMCGLQLRYRRKQIQAHTSDNERNRDFSKSFWDEAFGQTDRDTLTPVVDFMLFVQTTLNPVFCMSLEVYSIHFAHLTIFNISYFCYSSELRSSLHSQLKRIQYKLVSFGSCIILCTWSLQCCMQLAEVYVVGTDVNE
jgi:hypothetical protein